MVFFAFLYSPFLLLLKFSLANKGKPSALSIVFVTMLVNSVGGFFMSYEASIVAKTDTGGALMFAVLPMFQLAISGIGVVIVKGRAK